MNTSVRIYQYALRPNTRHQLAFKTKANGFLKMIRVRSNGIVIVRIYRDGKEPKNELWHMNPESVTSIEIPSYFLPKGTKIYVKKSRSAIPADISLEIVEVPE